MKPGNNLRIHLFDSSKTGFLGINDFEDCVSKDEILDVYFCGPKPMRKKIRNDFDKKVDEIILDQPFVPNFAKKAAVTFAWST